MSVSAIIFSLSDVNSPAAEKSAQVAAQPQPGQPAEKDTPVTQITQDTVELTHFAQIQQLSLRGETASQIAAVTGLPLSEIDSDLNVATPSSNVTVTAANASNAPSAVPTAQASNDNLPADTSNNNAGTTVSAPPAAS